MARREGREKVHQAFGLDVVVFHQGLYAVAVLFAAYVLVGGEIGDYVESVFPAEYAFEDGVCVIEGVAAEFIRYVQPVGAADVADEFGQAVFVEVYDHHAAGPEGQGGFDEAGPYAAGTADDADAGAFYLLAEGGAVLRKVFRKQASAAVGDVLADERIKLEHNIQI